MYGIRKILYLKQIWFFYEFHKSSGADGWEDRSYGSSSENSQYESGRSRRKRGASNDVNVSNEDNN